MRNILKGGVVLKFLLGFYPNTGDLDLDDCLVPEIIIKSEITQIETPDKRVEQMENGTNF